VDQAISSGVSSSLCMIGEMDAVEQGVPMGRTPAVRIAEMERLDT